MNDDDALRALYGKKRTALRNVEAVLTNPMLVDDVKIKQVVIRDYALATLVRPYENLKNTYKRIFTEGLSGINRSSSTGPVIEIYKNDPKGTPPKKLITQIYVPVKP